MDTNPFEQFCRVVGHEILFLAFKRAAVRASTTEEFRALCDRWDKIEDALMHEAIE